MVSLRAWTRLPVFAGPARASPLALVAAFATALLGLAALYRKRLWAPPALTAPVDPANAANPADGSITTPSGSGSITTPSESASKPAADSNALEDAQLTAGTKVLLTGLQNRPELNGLKARVRGFDASKGRYSVKLVSDSRMLQLRPSNLIVDTSSAEPFYFATLSDHGALTSNEAVQAVEMLQKGTFNQSTPLEGGLLLRCLVCFKEWYVPMVQKGNGVPMFYTFPVADKTGIALFSDERKFEAFRPQLTVERDVQLGAVAMPGHEVFSVARHDVHFLMFDAGPDRVPCTVPTEQLLPLTLGLRLEMEMKDFMKAFTNSGATLPKRAHDAFTNANFFCFDASSDPEFVNPVTAKDGNDSFVLLYTSPELRDLAESPLRELGAFANLTIMRTQMPAKAVLDSLLGGSHYACVSINEFVPGLNTTYTVSKLRTAALRQMFA